MFLLEFTLGHCGDKPWLCRCCVFVLHKCGKDYANCSNRRIFCGLEKWKESDRRVCKRLAEDVWDVSTPSVSAVDWSCELRSFPNSCKLLFVVYFWKESSILQVHSIEIEDFSLILPVKYDERSNFEKKHVRLFFVCLKFPQYIQITVKIPTLKVHCEIKRAITSSWSSVTLRLCDFTLTVIRIGLLRFFRFYSAWSTIIQHY